MADPLSLTPEQTQKLVEQGTITPQTAQAITEDPALAESALRPVNSSLEQAEESVTPEVQTPEVQAEEVQAADALETVDQVEEGPSAQDRFKRKKVELQSAGPRGFGRVVSDSQVLDALEQEDAQLLQDQQELDSERQSRLDRRRQDLQRAATLGITLEANELDDEINAADGQAPATEQDQVAAQAPTRDEVDLAAEPIRQEAAVERAAKEVLEEKEQEVAQQQKAINESIQREDERFEAEEEAQGFWAKKNTAEKIGLALSVALGAIGSAIAKTPNAALQIVEKAIDEDLALQKLSQQESIAKKQFAFKQAGLRLQQRAAATNDEVSKLKIKQIQQSIQAKELELFKQREKSKAIAAGGQIPVSELSKLDRQSVVGFRDGSYGIANSPQVANKLNEFQGEVIPAIDGAERVLELSKQGSRFNLFDRAKVATEIKALVGQLRIPFTGPGVLTDTEYERLLGTIGDPNKLFALPSVERTKLQSVVKKLTSDLEGRYKRAGLTPPADPNQRNLEILIKNNPGLSEEKARDALEATGNWKAR